jgi:hypothetical protein
VNLFSLFQKKKEVHEIISSAGEIQENLEWALRNGIILRICGESGGEVFRARLRQMDHSKENAFIGGERLDSEESIPALEAGETVKVEYELQRDVRHLFHAILLKEVSRSDNTFRIGYPSLIESFQDYHSVRFKNLSSEPIQVDMDKDRGIVIDIGMSGFQFTSNRVFETGEMVRDFQVALPRYGRVQGSAVVKYTRPSSDYPLWRYRCGVEFVELKPKDQKKLSRYVMRIMRQQPAKVAI